MAHIYYQHSDMQQYAEQLGIQFDPEKLDAVLQSRFQNEDEQNAYRAMVDFMLHVIKPPYTTPALLVAFQNNDGSIRLSPDSKSLSIEDSHSIINGVIHDAMNLNNFDMQAIKDCIKNNINHLLMSKNEDSQIMWQNMIDKNAKESMSLCAESMKYYFTHQRELPPTHTPLTQESYAILEDCDTPQAQQMCIDLLLSCTNITHIQDMPTLKEIQQLISHKPVYTEIRDDRIQASVKHINHQMWEAILETDIRKLTDRFAHFVDVVSREEAMQERNKMVEYIATLSVDDWANTPINMLSNVGCTLDVLADFEKYCELYEKDFNVRAVSSRLVSQVEPDQHTGALKTFVTRSPIPLRDLAFLQASNAIKHKDKNLEAPIFQQAVIALKEGLRKILGGHEYEMTNTSNAMLPNVLNVKMLNHVEFALEINENELLHYSPQYSSVQLQQFHAGRALTLKNKSDAQMNMEDFINGISLNELNTIFNKNMALIEQPHFINKPN